MKVLRLLGDPGLDQVLDLAGLGLDQALDRALDLAGLDLAGLDQARVALEEAAHPVPLRKVIQWGAAT